MPSMAAAEKPTAPERMPTATPPPRLLTPTRPGPAIMNTGVSTMMRSRMYGRGPAAHQEKQTTPTTRASTTAILPAVASEMMPSRPATRNASAATAANAPPPATYRSRRTRRRSCSGGRVIGADAAPRRGWSVALGSRRGVRPVLTENGAVVLLAAVVEGQPGNHDHRHAGDRAVLLVPLGAVVVVPRPGQVDGHRGTVDDRDHVRDHGPSAEIEEAKVRALQVPRPPAQPLLQKRDRDTEIGHVHEDDPE